MTIRAIDLAGQRFGDLVVVERVPSEKKGAHWLCKCDCGSERVVLGSRLLNEEIEHCGCKPRRKFPKDITGMKFGRYLVIIEGRKECLCQCDCGSAAKYVQRNSLLNGHSKSCGCLARERAVELAGRGYGVAAFTKIVLAYKNNAKKRGLEFALSDDAVRTLTKMNCHYCGSSPSRVSKAIGGEYIYNGIDRADSSRGYTPDNVAPCCTECNRAKRAMDTGEFIEWVARIHLYGGYDRCAIPNAGNGAFMQVVYMYKNSASRRGIEWGLSDNEVLGITQQPCCYCGERHSNTARLKGDEYKYNGIDRADNSMGYVANNCVPCCSQCNAAKR